LRWVGLEEVGVGRTRQSGSSAGGDNVDTVAAVVGEGRAKVVSAVPVGIPREAVVGTVERQTELAGGMK
jgi:hypothetical protein